MAQPPAHPPQTLFFGLLLFSLLNIVLAILAWPGVITPGQPPYTGSTEGIAGALGGFAYAAAPAAWPVLLLGISWLGWARRTYPIALWSQVALLIVNAVGLVAGLILAGRAAGA